MMFSILFLWISIDPQCLAYYSCGSPLIHTVWHIYSLFPLIHALDTPSMIRLNIIVARPLIHLL